MPGHRISDKGGERLLADKMARMMRRKLRRNRGKLHWREPGVSDAYLMQRLADEVMELAELIDPGVTATSDEVWEEAADVANFAAMIADRHTPERMRQLERALGKS